jgi:hypothetical protein
MVDLQTISIAVASASVVVGVVYYALQIRHQDRMRHLDLFMRLYSIWGSEDMLDAHRRFLALKVEGWDDFVDKYGPIAPIEKKPSQIVTDVDRIGWFFNLMGFLVKEKIVHVRLVDELLGYWVIRNWETLKPLVYGWRKQYNIPKSYLWFEYLYSEMQKREQQAGAKNG